LFFFKERFENMGCCSQTTHNYWWADQDLSSATTLQGQALGIENVSEDATGQWYLYYGSRQGAMEYKVNQTRYQAGRMGRSRFVNVDVSDVLNFEHLYGRDFTLLGASNHVNLNALLQPATSIVSIVPLGITDRALRLQDCERAGDIIGADPVKLAETLSISEEAVKNWILALRKEVGFGNSVVVVSSNLPAVDSTTGKVEVFDFAMLHGVTPMMEDDLLQAEIYSSADFLAAGADKLAAVLGKPRTITADLVEELAHYISEKGEKKKIRKKGGSRSPHPEKQHPN